MPVKISTSSTKASNKPQPLPKPKPPFELFPKSLSMNDGRIIRRSVPVPDRLTMLVDIHEGIYGPKMPSGVTVAQWVLSAGHYLASAPHNTQHLDTGYFQKKHWYGHVTLGMGDRDTSVRFEFSDEKTKTPAQLRLEMNPRKLGPKGFKTLLAILNDPHGPFAGKAILQCARVTRIDIAIDLEGVQVDEVVAFHDSEQKRSMYIGTDGVIETLYIHGKSNKAKPAGKVLVSIYDRSKERIRKGKPPPFGQSPVTRIEVTRNLKAPYNSLSKVAGLGDPFGSIRVGYLMAQGMKPENWWSEYVGLRRTKSHSSSVALLGLDKATAAKFADGYLVPIPNLVSDGTTWQGWEQGLKVTGMQLLLKAATANGS